MLSLPVNVLLAAAGGCLDAFTYVGHGHVFANAMTGNVVLLAVFAASGGWRESLRHVPPIVTFLVGISCVRALGLPRFRLSVAQRAIAVLIVEILAFFSLTWLPAAANNFLIVIVICFVASLQTGTFRQVNNASYNSTYTTGNLRTLSESLSDWLFNGRAPASRQKTLDFASVCSAFFLGALLGGLLTPRLQNRCLLFVVALLTAVLLRITARSPLPRAESPHSPPASSSLAPPAHSGPYR